MVVVINKYIREVYIKENKMLSFRRNASLYQPGSLSIFQCITSLPYKAIFYTHEGNRVFSHCRVATQTTLCFLFILAAEPWYAVIQDDRGKYKKPESKKRGTIQIVSWVKGQNDKGLIMVIVKIFHSKKNVFFLQRWCICSLFLYSTDKWVEGDYPCAWFMEL